MSKFKRGDTVVFNGKTGRVTKVFAFQQKYYVESDDVEYVVPESRLMRYVCEKGSTKNHAK